MRILYGYSNCSDRLYKKITAENNAAVLRADQKYHGLLVKGLAACADEVDCVSGLPINRTVTKRLLIHERDEREGNIHYHYITTVNLPILRQLMIFCGTFWRALREKKKDTYAICDCLNLANAYGMSIACRMKHIPVVTIVTDLPDMQRGNRLLKWLNNMLFGLIDGFIILTEYMNQQVNPKGKPYIVMEGHADSASTAVLPDEKLEKKASKKVIVYAGSLQRIYGIDNLVEGFMLAGIPASELWVYGDGDYRHELELKCKTSSAIYYMGIKDNAEIVEVEQKAALLVNPRPSSPEYTKYSFPSKTMEYMVSGTPVLTTKLPGIPQEYYPYVYTLEDESANGVAEALKNVFSEDEQRREQKGRSAREFVLAQKSNVVQANRVSVFLRDEVSGAKQ